MAITISDIPEVHEKASNLFAASKKLLRFMERVVTALDEDERLVALTPDQKQAVVLRYHTLKNEARTAAANLME